VSADGSVIVGGGFGAPAFRWTRETGIQSLGVGIATCVSASGDHVGGGTGSSMFWWSGATGRINLDVVTSTYRATDAFGMSADGQTMVGTGGDITGIEALMYRRPSTFIRLGDLPGGDKDAVAYAVSASGAIVFGAGATAESGSRSEAFRYAPGLGFTSLGDLPGGDRESIAYACSDDGSVAYGVSNAAAGHDPFRWTPATGMVALNAPLAGLLGTFLYGSSGDGSLACGFAAKDGGFTAMLWSQDQGWETVSDFLAARGVQIPTGWRLESAYDISSDGLTIVGKGTNPAGFSEPWVATIPAPGPLSLLALGAIRRRRQPRS